MKISPPFMFSALTTLAFTLATLLAPHAEHWSAHAKSDNLFGMMFGDARKLFANQFFTMADVYFHSGYYPTIFDQNAQKQKEMISESRGKKESEEDEKNEDFLGKPHDWIDAFGRNFKITQHTHLENGHEREILPWLRLAAELDPQNPTTFTVGAFYLREHLGRTAEAEKFLREGIRQNPDDCELLFELGRLYHDGLHDLDRARNLWELGVKKFLAQTDAQKKENKLIYEKIVVNLGRLEAAAGNFPQAVKWLHIAQAVSPAPDALQRQIDEIQKKISTPAKPELNR
jgi:tetratricopeptide (TPR) repeat protein